MLGEIAELKRQAHRRLPKAVFDFLEGGAGDERDLMRNTQALADITFEPRRLVDVSNINVST